MEQDKWMAQARQYADTYWAYAQLVDDQEEKFLQLFIEGAAPMDAVVLIGEKYDLIPWTAWGNI